MTDTITLAGGCFWCVEAVFLRFKGIEKVVSGYSNGHKENPTYKEVCTGTTGHAEVVQITYDTEQIDLPTILEIFWASHDPTTLNRQGNDVGTQYRSGIYYTSEEQCDIALLSKKNDATKIWTDPIVTEVVELESYYPAEEYHHNYFKLNPQNRYCSIVVGPKVAKVHRKYAHLLKED